MKSVCDDTKGKSDFYSWNNSFAFLFFSWALLPKNVTNTLNTRSISLYITAADQTKRYICPSTLKTAGRGDDRLFFGDDVVYDDEKRGTDSDDGRERWRSGDHREEGHLVPHVREVVSPSGMRWETFCVGDGTTTARDDDDDDEDDFDEEHARRIDE